MTEKLFTGTLSIKQTKPNLFHDFFQGGQILEEGLVDFGSIRTIVYGDGGNVS